MAVLARRPIKGQLLVDAGIDLRAGCRSFFNNNEILFLTAYYNRRMELRECIIYSKRHLCRLLLF